MHGKFVISLLNSKTPIMLQLQNLRFPLRIVHLWQLHFSVPKYKSVRGDGCSPHSILSGANTTMSTPSGLQIQTGIHLPAIAHIFNPEPCPRYVRNFIPVNLTDERESRTDYLSPLYMSECKCLFLLW